MQNENFFTRLVECLSEHKGKFGLGILFALLATIFSIGSSYTLKILIDDVLIANRPDLLWPIQGVFILLVLLQSLFTLVRDKTFFQVGASILAKLRITLFDRIANANVLAISANQKGDLISVVNYDVDGLEGVISNGIPTLVSSVIQITLTLVIMFLLNVRLTLIALPIIPIYSSESAFHFALRIIKTNVPISIIQW